MRAGIFVFMREALLLSALKKVGDPPTLLNAVPKAWSTSSGRATLLAFTARAR